jgi:hypothetical protein
MTQTDHDDSTKANRIRPRRVGSVTTTSPVAAGLTSAQEAQICGDLLAWSKVATNEDMPRFTQTLVNDVGEAGNSQLGTDMSSLESDLTQINSLALEPGPPGQPSSAQAVDYDCQHYGVSIPLWG